MSPNGYANPPFNWPWTGTWQTIGGGGQRYGVVDTPTPNTPLAISAPYVPSVM